MKKNATLLFLDMFFIYLKFKLFSKKSLWFHLLSNFTMQLYLRSRLLFVLLLLLLCTVWFDAVCYFTLILAVLSIMYLEPFCQNSQLASPTYVIFHCIKYTYFALITIIFPLPITTISCGSFVCRPVAMHICRAAINLFWSVLHLLKRISNFSVVVCSFIESIKLIYLEFIISRNSCFPASLFTTINRFPQRNLKKYRNYREYIWSRKKKGG